MSDEMKELELKWYAVHALSGYEEKAKNFLLYWVKDAELEDHFGEIIVPTETVVSVVDGKKKESQAPAFRPGP